MVSKVSWTFNSGGWRRARSAAWAWVRTNLLFVAPDVSDACVCGRGSLSASSSGHDVRPGDPGLSSSSNSSDAETWGVEIGVNLTSGSSSAEDEEAIATREDCD